MSDFDAIADAYIDMWNETDTTARKARVEQLFAPGGCYTDPLADVTGHDQIDAMINAVQQQFPGMHFTLVGPVDAPSPTGSIRLDSRPVGGRVTDRRIRRTRTRRRRPGDACPRVSRQGAFGLNRDYHRQRSSRRLSVVRGIIGADERRRIYLVHTDSRVRGC